MAGYGLEGMLSRSQYEKGTVEEVDCRDGTKCPLHEQRNTERETKKRKIFTIFYPCEAA